MTIKLWNADGRDQEPAGQIEYEDAYYARKAHKAAADEWEAAYKAILANNSPENKDRFDKASEALKEQNRINGGFYYAVYND